MNRVITLCFLGLSASLVSAADLSDIPRKIGKEPKYQSQPKYCLLVFGPEAKTRVWLVQDGPVLYVDRNGNGDLTDEGERVVAAKSEYAEEGEYTFKAGEIHDGDRRHTDLAVFVAKLDNLAAQDSTAKEFLTKNPKAKGYSVRVAMDHPGWKGTGVGGRVEWMTFLLDVNGLLQFSDKPQDAPIIHFGGQLQVTLFGKHRLTIDRDEDVVLGIGTPGVGPGTTAYIGYEGVMPANLNPVLEIIYPPKKPGDPPVQERYQLKDRC
jgi:hypothetical protein